MFTDYKIIHGSIFASDGQKIEDKVQAALREGWQPYGIPFMGPNNFICQAVVKFEQ
jgi:hypothetical protein